MLRLKSEITIEGENTYIFDFCHKATVETSFNTFIDTAIVHLPNGLRFKNNLIINEIKRGDKITIKLGYAPELITVFIGYVSRVTPDETMVLNCEDEGFKAKQLKLDNKIYKTVDLETLITEQYDGDFVINGDVPNLGTIKIERNPNFVELLNLLKSVYGMTSFWRDEVLNIQPALFVEDKITIFKSNFNIIDDSNLTYIEEDAYNVVSEGVSLQDDNTKIVWYAFYKDGVKTTSKEAPSGVVSTFRVPNQADSDLKTLTLNRLDGLVYTGYSGGFQAFGKPFVKHSEKVTIQNDQIPDRDGTYMIESVNYEFGIGGFRQDIEIKYKQ